MIKVIEVKTMDDVMDMVKDQQVDETIGRLRSKYFYRGMNNSTYHLTSSLRLNCKELSKELEPAILNSFSKYSMLYDESIGESVWQQMIIGQHHGLPTRLLDWTGSPLIALHFANSVNDMRKLDSRDGIVWRIDVNETNSNLPEKYKLELRRDNDIFSVQTLTKVAKDLTEYDNDMGDRAFACIEPSSIDQRIVNQYSFFSVIPSGMTNIEDFLDKYTNNTVKYIIKSNIRWDIRDMLDQFNISERMIYPGLDGLCKTLQRHYYVKDDSPVINK